MLVLVCVIAPALAVGAVAMAVATRLPAITSPAARVDRIAPRLATHPRVLRFLRTRTDPGVVTGLALTALAIVIVVTGASVGIILLVVRNEVGAAPFDVRIAEFAADHATSASTAVLRAITLLGGTAGAAVVAVVVGAVELRRAPTRAVVAFLVVVVAGQSLLANGIKWIVERARPTVDQLTGAGGTSFPSGHTTAAAATFAAAALLLGRGRSRRAQAALTGGAAAIAVAVGGTRVMLGVHWLTDVLAGLLVGWAWFAVCSIGFGGRLLRFGQPAEAAEQVASAP